MNFCLIIIILSNFSLINSKTTESNSKMKKLSDQKEKRPLMVKLLKLLLKLNLPMKVENWQKDNNLAWRRWVKFSAEYSAELESNKETLLLVDQMVNILTISKEEDHSLKPMTLDTLIDKFKKKMSFY